MERAEPSTGRARLSWIVAGVIGFVGCAVPIASMRPLREQISLRGEAHRVVDEVAIALSADEVDESKTSVRRLRALLDRLSPSQNRAALLRSVATSVAAYTSAPTAEARRQSQHALARLEVALLTENRSAESELMRLALGASLVGICASLLLVLIGFRGESDREESLDETSSAQPILKRLGRLVEISGRRERRTGRFLASMDATLIDIDKTGQIEHISPGGSQLFRVPTGELLGKPIRDVVLLTSDEGIPVQSFRHASASQRAYWLQAKDSSRQLVTVDFFEDSTQGASILLRLAGSREARRRMLREFEAALEVSFSDNQLLVLLVDGGGRVRRASPAAERWLGFSGSGASVYEPWAEQAGLSEFFRQPPPIEQKEVSYQRTLQSTNGQSVDVTFRWVRVADIGWWIRGVVSKEALRPGRTISRPREASDITKVDTAPYGASEKGCLSFQAKHEQGIMRLAQVPNGREAIIPEVNGRLGSSEAHKPKRRPQILVIDDEPAIGRAITRALKDIDVEVAEGGAEGLRCALGQSHRWDLILCDIGMPEVDGVQVYEELDVQNPELLKKTLFMTGALHTERARQFVEVVGPPLLKKPFDVSQVRKALEVRQTIPMTRAG